MKQLLYIVYKIVILCLNNVPGCAFSPAIILHQAEKDTDGSLV